MIREDQVEKMLDELEEEFAKANMPINDKLTLFAKVSNAIYKCTEQEPCDDMGEVSDGYHTFNQLYHQRAVLFATIVNQNKDKSWKSFKHSDGKYCFDSNGEWFIVGIDTPQGSYTYHYAKEYWDMFDCEELECGKEWDGHTEEDVTRLLSLQQEPCDDEYIKVPKKALKYKTAGMVAYNYEWLKNHIDVERNLILAVSKMQEAAQKERDGIDQYIDSITESCEDCISRQAVLDMLEDINAETEGVGFYYKHYVEYIKNLPPVTPQYTEAEIQKMQDLESAEIQKAYEIGKAEGSEVLDKIRAEIDEQYDRVHPYNISCAEGLEMALDIIDKYKASPTGAESEGME